MCFACFECFEEKKNHIKTHTVAEAPVWNWVSFGSSKICLKCEGNLDPIFKNRNKMTTICEKCSTAQCKDCGKDYLKHGYYNFCKACKLTCTICGKKFKLYSRLKRHINSAHEKIKPFKCDVCDIRYTNKHLLKRHKRLRHENAPRDFKCEQCGKGMSKY